MVKKKCKKEENKRIYKYQKRDVNNKLASVLGDDFIKYRSNYNKTINYPKSKFIPGFPITLYLEPYNRCNLNCAMCYKKHHQEPRAELSLMTIEKIIAECKKNKLSALILTLGSEILLYKDIKKLINLAGRAGIIDVHIGSNGVLLDEKIAGLIIKNKITRLKISLDAATNEIYKQIRIGSPGLEHVEANINKLIELKNKAKSPFPAIRLCFVVMDINKHEIPEFISKWKDKVDYIDFQKYFDSSSVDNASQIKLDDKKYTFCALPFNSLSVWADGMITPCCSFLGKEMALGNIYKQSLGEVWQGDKIKEIRAQIANKQLNVVCQKCLQYSDDNEKFDNSFSNV